MRDIDDLTLDVFLDISKKIVPLYHRNFTRKVKAIPEQMAKDLIEKVETFRKMK